MTGDVNLTHIRDALDRRAWHVGLVCERCGDRLSYDQDSGYWMHREMRDGRNGLYCSSESWTWEDGRELAVPTDPALAQLAAAEAVIQAARELVDLAADDAAGAIDNIGEPTSDFESDVLKLARLTLVLRDSIAALEDGQ